MKAISFILLCLLVLAAPIRGQSLQQDSLSFNPPLEKAPAISVPVESPSGAFNSTLNSIGSLFNDDRQYYTRQPIWLPLLKITLSNTGLWLADRYIFNCDFSHIGFNSWSENLKRGWTWRDTDRFANDFFF